MKDQRYYMLYSLCLSIKLFKPFNRRLRFPKKTEFCSNDKILRKKLKQTHELLRADWGKGRDPNPSASYHQQRFWCCGGEIRIGPLLRIQSKTGRLTKKNRCVKECSIRRFVSWLHRVDRIGYWKTRICDVTHNPRGANLSVPCLVFQNLAVDPW